MSKVATITSKRQITIPVKVFRKLELSQGDKVLVEEKEGSLTITPVKQVIDQLAGSVSVPEHLKEIDLDNAISQAKADYFKREK